jgi:hypothetical protein
MYAELIVGLYRNLWCDVTVGYLARSLNNSYQTSAWIWILQRCIKKVSSESVKIHVCVERNGDRLQIFALQETVTSWCNHRKCWSVGICRCEWNIRDTVRILGTVQCYSLCNGTSSNAICTRVIWRHCVTQFEGLVQGNQLAVRWCVLFGTRAVSWHRITL